MHTKNTLDMKDYENSDVKYLLDELKRIISHAEKAIPKVEEGDDQRLEEINFEQLTRESESKINVLRREIQDNKDIEIMRLALDEMNVVVQRFQQFDKQFIANKHEQLLFAKKEYEEAKNKRSSYDSDLDDDLDITSEQEPDLFTSLFKAGTIFVTLLGRNNANKHVRTTKENVDNIIQAITRFEQTTTEFRSVVRELFKIRQILFERIEEATINDIEEKVAEENESNNPKSKAGRKHEPWWGERWEQHTEQEVEEHIKQTYEATRSILCNLEAEKTIRDERTFNAVWAAIYFYVAKIKNVICPGKSANCISYVGDTDKPRGLNKLGISCTKNTVLTYYNIVKVILEATTERNCKFPSVNLFIKIVEEDKDTDKYSSVREWLQQDKNLAALKREINEEKATENIIIFVGKNEGVN